MFRFYKTILNLKTRLKEQNLKQILFFHYHLNLLIFCKTKLKIKFIRIHVLQNAFVLQNEFFLTERIFFLTELNFLKGGTNIYFK